MTWKIYYYDMNHTCIKTDTAQSHHEAMAKLAKEIFLANEILYAECYSDEHADLDHPGDA